MSPDDGAPRQGAADSSTPPDEHSARSPTGGASPAPPPAAALEVSRTPALHALLRRASRRRHWLHFVEGAVWGLLVAALVALDAVLADRLFAYRPTLLTELASDWPAWLPYAALFVASSIMGGSVGALLAPRELVRSALAIEQRFALKERLSSILLLHRDAGHVDPQAAALLLADGERHARSVDVRRALPLTRPRAAWPSAICAALFFAALLLPPFDLLGAQEEREARVKEEKRVAETRKRLRKRIDELKKRAELERVSPQTKKLLARMQKRAAEKRRKSREQGAAKTPARRKQLADMERMREDLRALRDRKEMKALDGFLDKVRRGGQKMQSEAGKQLAKALAGGDLAQAAQAAQRLAQELARVAKEKGEHSAEFEKLAQDLARVESKLQDLPGLDKKLAEKLAQGEELDAADLSALAQSSAHALDELRRLAREREILDQAAQQIELTEAELAMLPQEFPEGPG